MQRQAPCKCFYVQRHVVEIANGPALRHADVHGSLKPAVHREIAAVRGEISTVRGSLKPTVRGEKRALEYTEQVGYMKMKKGLGFFL